MSLTLEVIISHESHPKQKTETLSIAQTEVSLHYTMSSDAMREKAIIFHISEPTFISRS